MHHYLQRFTTKEMLVLEPYSHTHIWMLPFKSFVIFLIGFLFAVIMDLVICNPMQNAVYRILLKQHGRAGVDKEMGKE